MLVPPPKPGDKGDKSEQLPLAIAKDLSEVVFTQVLGDDAETLRILTSLTSHVSSDKLASKLGSLREAIEKGEIAKVETTANTE